MTNQDRMVYPPPNSRIDHAGVNEDDRKLVLVDVDCDIGHQTVNNLCECDGRERGKIRRKTGGLCEDCGTDRTRHGELNSSKS